MVAGDADGDGLVTVARAAHTQTQYFAPATDEIDPLERTGVEATKGSDAAGKEIGASQASRFAQTSGYVRHNRRHRAILAHGANSKDARIQSSVFGSNVGEARNDDDSATRRNKTARALRLRKVRFRDDIPTGFVNIPQPWKVTVSLLVALGLCAALFFRAFQRLTINEFYDVPLGSDLSMDIQDCPLEIIAGSLVDLEKNDGGEDEDEDGGRRGNLLRAGQARIRVLAWEQKLKHPRERIFQSNGGSTRGNTKWRDSGKTAGSLETMIENHNAVRSVSQFMLKQHRSDARFLCGVRLVVPTVKVSPGQNDTFRPPLRSLSIKHSALDGGTSLVRLAGDLNVQRLNFDLTHTEGNFVGNFHTSRARIVLKDSVLKWRQELDAPTLTHDKPNKFETPANGIGEVGREKVARKSGGVKIVADRSLVVLRVRNGTAVAVQNSLSTSFCCANVTRVSILPKGSSAELAAAGAAREWWGSEGWWEADDRDEIALESLEQKVGYFGEQGGTEFASVTGNIQIQGTKSSANVSPLEETEPINRIHANPLPNDIGRGSKNSLSDLERSGISLAGLERANLSQWRENWGVLSDHEYAHGDLWTQVNPLQGVMEEKGARGVGKRSTPRIPAHQRRAFASLRKWIEDRRRMPWRIKVEMFSSNGMHTLWDVVGSRAQIGTQGRHSILSGGLLAPQSRRVTFFVFDVDCTVAADWFQGHKLVVDGLESVRFNCQRAMQHIHYQLLRRAVKRGLDVSAYFIFLGNHRPNLARFDTNSATIRPLTLHAPALIGGKLSPKAPRYSSTADPSSNSLSLFESWRGRGLLAVENVHTDADREIGTDVWEDNGSDESDESYVFKDSASPSVLESSRVRWSKSRPRFVAALCLNVLLAFSISLLTVRHLVTILQSHIFVEIENENHPQIELSHRLYRDDDGPKSTGDRWRAGGAVKGEGPHAGGSRRESRATQEGEASPLAGSPLGGSRLGGRGPGERGQRSEAAVLSGQRLAATAEWDVVAFTRRRPVPAFVVQWSFTPSNVAGVVLDVEALDATARERAHTVLQLTIPFERLLLVEDPLSSLTFEIQMPLRWPPIRPWSRFDPLIGATPVMSWQLRHNMLYRLRLSYIDSSGRVLRVSSPTPPLRPPHDISCDDYIVVMLKRMFSGGKSFSSRDSWLFFHRVCLTPVATTPRKVALVLDVVASSAPPQAQPTRLEVSLSFPRMPDPPIRKRFRLHPLPLQYDDTEYFYYRPLHLYTKDAKVHNHKDHPLYYRIDQMYAAQSHAWLVFSDAVSGKSLGGYKLPLNDSGPFQFTVTSAGASSAVGAASGALNAAGRGAVTAARLRISGRLVEQEALALNERQKTVGGLALDGEVDHHTTGFSPSGPPRTKQTNIVPNQIFLAATSREIHWVPALGVALVSLTFFDGDEPCESHVTGNNGKFTWIVPDRPTTKGRLTIVPVITPGGHRAPVPELGDENGDAQHKNKTLLPLTFASNGSAISWEDEKADLISAPSIHIARSAKVRAILSPKFTVLRPLLVNQLEFAYASYCRTFSLPLEPLTTPMLTRAGLVFTEENIKVCPDLRLSLPMEDMPPNTLVNTPGQLLVSPTFIDAEFEGPTNRRTFQSVTRNLRVIHNYQLETDPGLWTQSQMSWFLINGWFPSEISLPIPFGRHHSGSALSEGGLVQALTSVNEKKGALVSLAQSGLEATAPSSAMSPTTSVIRSNLEDRIRNRMFSAWQFLTSMRLMITHKLIRNSFKTFLWRKRIEKLLMTDALPQTLRSAMCILSLAMFHGAVFQVLLMAILMSTEPLRLSQPVHTDVSSTSLLDFFFLPSFRSRVLFLARVPNFVGVLLIALACDFVFKICVFVFMRHFVAQGAVLALKVNTAHLISLLVFALVGNMIWPTLVQWFVATAFIDTERCLALLMLLAAVVYAGHLVIKRFTEKRDLVVAYIQDSRHTFKRALVAAWFKKKSVLYSSYSSASPARGMSATMLGDRGASRGYFGEDPRMNDNESGALEWSLFDQITERGLLIEILQILGDNHLEKVEGEDLRFSKSRGEGLESCPLLPRGARFATEAECAEKAELVNPLLFGSEVAMLADSFLLGPFAAEAAVSLPPAHLSPESRQRQSCRFDRTWRRKTNVAIVSVPVLPNAASLPFPLKVVLVHGAFDKNQDGYLNEVEFYLWVCILKKTQVVSKGSEGIANVTSLLYWSWSNVVARFRETYGALVDGAWGFQPSHLAAYYELRRSELDADMEHLYLHRSMQIPPRNRARAPQTHSTATARDQQCIRRVVELVKERASACALPRFEGATSRRRVQRRKMMLGNQAHWPELSDEELEEEKENELPSYSQKTNTVGEMDSTSKEIELSDRIRFIFQAAVAAPANNALHADRLTASDRKRAQAQSQKRQGKEHGPHAHDPFSASHSVGAEDSGKGGRKGRGKAEGTVRERERRNEDKRALGASAAGIVALQSFRRLIANELHDILQALCSDDHVRRALIAFQDQRLSDAVRRKVLMLMDPCKGLKRSQVNHELGDALERWPPKTARDALNLIPVVWSRSMTGRQIFRFCEQGAGFEVTCCRIATFLLENLGVTSPSSVRTIRAMGAGATSDQTLITRQQRSELFMLKIIRESLDAVPLPTGEEENKSGVVSFSTLTRDASQERFADRLSVASHESAVTLKETSSAPEMRHIILTADRAIKIILGKYLNFNQALILLESFGVNIFEHPLPSCAPSAIRDHLSQALDGTLTLEGMLELLGPPDPDFIRWRHHLACLLDLPLFEEPFVLEHHPVSAHASSSAKPVEPLEHQSASLQRESRIVDHSALIEQVHSKLSSLRVPLETVRYKYHVYCANIASVRGTFDQFTGHTDFLSPPLAMPFMERVTSSHYSPVCKVVCCRSGPILHPCALSFQSRPRRVDRLGGDQRSDSLSQVRLRIEDSAFDPLNETFDWNLLIAKNESHPGTDLHKRLTYRQHGRVPKMMPSPVRKSTRGRWRKRSGRGERGGGLLLGPHSKHCDCRHKTRTGASPKKVESRGSCERGCLQHQIAIGKSAYKTGHQLAELSRLYREEKLQINSSLPHIDYAIFLTLIRRLGLDISESFCQLLWQCATSRLAAAPSPKDLGVEARWRHGAFEGATATLRVDKAITFLFRTFSEVQPRVALPFFLEEAKLELRPSEVDELWRHLPKCSLRLRRPLAGPRSSKGKGRFPIFRGMSESEQKIVFWKWSTDPLASGGAPDGSHGRGAAVQKRYFASMKSHILRLSGSTLSTISHGFPEEVALLSFPGFVELVQKEFKISLSRSSLRELFNEVDTLSRKRLNHAQFSKALDIIVTKSLAKKVCAALTLDRWTQIKRSTAAAALAVAVASFIVSTVSNFAGAKNGFEVTLQRILGVGGALAFNRQKPREKRFEEIKAEVNRIFLSFVAIDNLSDFLKGDTEDSNFTIKGVDDKAQTNTAADGATSALTTSHDGVIDPGRPGDDFSIPIAFCYEFADPRQGYRRNGRTLFLIDRSTDEGVHKLYGSKGESKQEESEGGRGEAELLGCDATAGREYLEFSVEGLRGCVGFRYNLEICAGTQDDHDEKDEDNEGGTQNHLGTLAQAPQLDSNTGDIKIFRHRPSQLTVRLYHFRSSTILSHTFTLRIVQ